jgi:hypothetical protein
VHSTKEALSCVIPNKPITKILISLLTKNETAIFSYAIKTGQDVSQKEHYNVKEAWDTTNTGVKSQNILLL